MNIRRVAFALAVTLLSGYLISRAEDRDPLQSTEATEVHDSCTALGGGGSEFQPLRSICKYALALPHTLPDLICTEHIERRFLPKKKADIVTAEVRIENMHSHYAYVTVNGKTLKALPGVSGDEQFANQITSTGEFAQLFNVFNGATHTLFSAPIDAVINGKAVKRYNFRVRREDNYGWSWVFLDMRMNPGYHGSVFVDGTSGAIIRLTLKVDSSEIDPDTPVSEATTYIDYSDVMIGSLGTRHVPTEGKNVSCFRRVLTGCVEEKFAFRDFHLFKSDTKILP